MCGDAVFYKWRPIEDLPANWKDLAHEDLYALGDIWSEQQEHLKGTKGLQTFNERLRRQWAIETGIIEGLYSIDRGITILLIERGIETSLIPHGSSDKPAERIVPILKDQEHVLEGVFDFVAKGKPLSNFYIRELHSELTRNQDFVQAKDQFGQIVEVPIVRGDWKKLPNNPTRPDGLLHGYCPPEHVQSEMDRLIEMHLQHVDMHVPPEIEAAWLHHRFTQIHPFQDGNGRVARALASLILLRARWFPVVIDRDVRDRYIHALEAADSGDLSILVDLFSQNIKQFFKKALSISEEVLTSQQSLKHIIESAVDKIRRKEAVKNQERAVVFMISSRLEETAYQTARDAANELNRILSRISQEYSAVAWRSREDQGHWFTFQVIETAKQLDYYADLRMYHHWVRIRIREKRQTEIVISFHPVGTNFLGVMGVSAYIEDKNLDRNDEEQTSPSRFHPICREPFQFTYGETNGRLLERFEKWLHEVLLVGLDEWRRLL